MGLVLYTPGLALSMGMLIFLLQLGNRSCHYDNTPIQYTVIFHDCKKDYFQMKNSDIFLIFAQNIDCGCTLEPPQ